MPIPPHVRRLREHVGSELLLLPSVTALILDDARRVLLVWQRDGVWSTPGGAIEIGEHPADAVVREVWEETGLVVTPRRLVGVYGGSECRVQYPNSDRVEYVMSLFECAVTGGALRPISDETDGAAYFSPSDFANIELSAWARTVLPHALAPTGPGFVAATWQPPAGSDGIADATPSEQH